MNGMSRKATGISGLPLVILLSLSTMSGAWAADIPVAATATATAAAAAQPPAAPDEELAEILVRGKSLSREISEAEDAFFAVYNKVNKNDAFSITCGDAPMNPGSMIKLRACLPGFVVEAYRNRHAGRRAGLASYPVVRRCGSVTQVGMDGELFYTADYDCLNAGPMTYDSGTYFAGPSLDALISLRSNELAVHMMMVINSDPRLKQMGEYLASLYQESSSMRTRYDRLRPDGRKAPPAKANRGPRAL
jgi:hypothetical protein